MTILSYVVMGLIGIVSLINVDVQPPRLSDISKSLNNEINGLASIIKIKAKKIDETNINNLNNINNFKYYDKYYNNDYDYYMNMIYNKKMILY
jgi:hypothetical protein